jgi:hypothetical protein
VYVSYLKSSQILQCFQNISPKINNLSKNLRFMAFAEVGDTESEALENIF